MSDNQYAVVIETRNLGEASALVACDEVRFVGARCDGGRVVFRIEGDGRVIKARMAAYQRGELMVEAQRHDDCTHRLRKIIHAARDSGELA